MGGRMGMAMGLMFSWSSNSGRLVPGEDDDSDDDDSLDLSSSTISTKSSMYSTTLV